MQHKKGKIGYMVIKLDSLLNSFFFWSKLAKFFYKNNFVKQKKQEQNQTGP